MHIKELILTLEQAKQVCSEEGLDLNSLIDVAWEPFFVDYEDAVINGEGWSLPIIWLRKK